jgi:hypothetical protein
LRASKIQEKWNVIYGTKPEANVKGTARRLQFVPGAL